MSDERRQLKHEVYMRMAQQLARLSTCRRLSVGAVLLRRDGSVAGVGYNGALPGQPHCQPETCNPSARCFNTRHAERSALDYSTGEVAAAYVTHEPCLRCTQDLIARGCRAVYYLRSYDIADAAEAAARAWHVYSNGVTWRQLGECYYCDEHESRVHLVDITSFWASASGENYEPEGTTEVVVEALMSSFGELFVARPRYDDSGLRLAAVCDLDTFLGVVQDYRAYLPASLGRALLRTVKGKLK